MKYNDRGEEIPDDTPIEVPLKFKRPPTLQEQIKLMVQREVSQRAADIGMETFEEADDFEVEDDDLPPSNYEFTDMPVERMMGVSDLDGKQEKEDGKSDATRGEAGEVLREGVRPSSESQSGAGKDRSRKAGEGSDGDAVEGVKR